MRLITWQSPRKYRLKFTGVYVSIRKYQKYNFNFLKYSNDGEIQLFEQEKWQKVNIFVFSKGRFKTHSIQQSEIPAEFGIFVSFYAEICYIKCWAVFTGNDTQIAVSVANTAQYLIEHFSLHINLRKFGFQQDIFIRHSSVINPILMFLNF